MKITYSTGNIKSFGGINFADHIVRNASVYETIDKPLGGRGIKAEYSYSDLIRSYLLMVLCGGECAEDITEHLRLELSHVKRVEVYSMYSASCEALSLTEHLSGNCSKDRSTKYLKYVMMSAFNLALIFSRH
ncbi:hypothetical protein AQPE_2753 [Aquipluma nitroreducens]|uniref:Uncharacterized protein n=1 Tax=Aquipluma nitroreducens TaxID=2010828 RepID=A0A5K7SAK2_9BACT|nr:hypothetical protein [Aquipluma nitroreducens]BBE18590.1 hypothetical protein AQPE_2753 [Aquipluma nitroreducens]